MKMPSNSNIISIPELNQNDFLFNDEVFPDSLSPTHIDAFTIHLLRKDDEGVFEKVFHEYHKKLYFFFLKKTKSSGISEELVQETFIKLWSYRKRLNVSLSLSIQLFRIAKTTLIDLLRREAKSRIRFLSPDELTVLPETQIQPEPVDTHSVIIQLRKALSLLSPTRRKIIEQRLNGMTNQEIASNLSISIKTVENQINKAFHDIRKNICMPSLIMLLAICSY
jgi:RNA polymerase sigma-70 factor (ECF subfamily)